MIGGRLISLVGWTISTLLAIGVQKAVSFRCAWPIVGRKDYAMQRTTSDDRLHHHTDSLQFYFSLRKCNDSYISRHIHRALDALSDALRLYGPEHVFSSYNGGKDADIIMHLLRAVHAKYAADHGVPSPPKLVYFYNEDEFDEVLVHIDKVEKAYDLNVTRYSNGIAQGLKEHLEAHAKGHCAAYVLGTRKGDPNCHDQETFAPSSNWLPIPFMRVNPILHWEYGHVWHFLRTFALPYCPLYDQGYTSLGRRTQTLPNPALLRKTLDATSVSSYWPAYMLSDWALERAGRSKTESLVDSFIESPSPVPSEPSSDQAVEGHTAALLIIGDEILNGFTNDANLQVASKALASIGIPLKMVSIVADTIEAIAAEVLRMSQKFDVVITSGGIGPTHDDVTLKAIAHALNQEFVVNDSLLRYLQEVHYLEEAHGEEQLQAYERLAMLPEHSQLLFPPPPDDFEVSHTEGTRTSPSTPAREVRTKTWPILQCDNIFVLPGIPQYFSAKMKLIAKYFLSKQQVKECRKIVLDIEEQRLVESLNCIVAQTPTVKIGSYPFVDHPEFKTIVTVEGFQVESVEEAIQELLRIIPARAVLRVEKC